MNKYLAIFQNDIKNIFRDPTLMIIFLIPILIIILLRFGLTTLQGYIPQAMDYNKEIIGFFALLCAVLPGIVISFILLDEKDQQLYPVIKSTPASFSGFLFTRLIFMIIIGFIMSFIILLFNGIYSISIINMVKISLLSCLNSPIITLLISHFAKNKVEGLTLMKVSNLSLFIPIIIFFFDANWEYFLCVFPAFWVYKFIDIQFSNLIFLIACIYLISTNYFIFKFVVKRT